MTDWRTAGLENFGVFQPHMTDGRYGIPAILPEKLPDVKWTGFNYARRMKGKQPKTGVHFFVDDYQFRTVWENPVRYADVIQRFGAALTPDFSTYADMPQILQIWNHYRKHWLGAFWQSRGMVVIPTISWSTPESWEWCFDGEPTLPHTHKGYEHNEKGNYTVSPKEQKMIDRVTKTWYNYLNSK